MKKTKINPPVKLAVLGIAVFIALVLVIIYLVSALKNLDYFKIKYVDSNKPEEALDFSYLSGRNIFNIDLNKESRYISGQYPVYKNIRLFRILPNRLFVLLSDRRPIACVKLYRYFWVDNERILFDSPKDIDTDDFPLIIGLEKKITGPKAGRQYNIKELITALNIINEAQSDSFLKRYKIARIDITNPADISCFIRPQEYPQGQGTKDSLLLEVKIPQDDIRGKVQILAGLLNQLNEDITNIKYIDLRFKEPVVKLKDAA